MKFIILAVFAAFVCYVVADGPDMEQMAKKVATFANTYSGNLESFKAEVKNNIQSEPGQFTLEQTNKFLDQVKVSYNASIMPFEDFKKLVIDEKTKAGKIKTRK